MNMQASFGADSELCQDSKEGYFVALRRKANVERAVVFPEDTEDT